MNDVDPAAIIGKLSAFLWGPKTSWTHFSWACQKKTKCYGSNNMSVSDWRCVVYDSFARTFSNLGIFRSLDTYVEASLETD